MASVNTPEFWSDLYTRGNDGWELRQAAPPLVEFVERTPPAPGRVAVPGCGRGHDVRFLARRGHAERAPPVGGNRQWKRDLAGRGR